MASIDLIDTTEMYLKTIFELEEDGVTPLRARIVERLGQSGPTVSQTIARMERDNLVWVRDDRRLELTPKGQQIGTQVIRRHRLAERLLVDVIGVPWVDAHEEACRWEHVMSSQVEKRLQTLLSGPTIDPYGNPIPGAEQIQRSEGSIERQVQNGQVLEAKISRIGEPIQAEHWLLQHFFEVKIFPGVTVGLAKRGHEYVIWPTEGPMADKKIRIEDQYAPHLFIDLE